MAAGALAVQQFDRRRQVPGAVNGWAVIENGFATTVVLANSSDMPVFNVLARSSSTARHRSDIARLPAPWCRESILLPEAPGNLDLRSRPQHDRAGTEARTGIPHPVGRVWRKKSDVPSVASGGTTGGPTSTYAR